MDADLLTSLIPYILAAATIATVVTNLAKMAGDLPTWTKPVLAVVAGIGGLFLFVGIRPDTVFDRPTIFMCILAGLIGGAVGIGAYEIQRTATRAENNRTVDAYLTSVGKR